jgi:hypothetical protein
MWNKTCQRPHDQRFMVRGHEAVLTPAADPHQVRVIVLFDGWILWTERCRSRAEALDIAGITLDTFLCANKVA